MNLDLRRFRNLIQDEFQAMDIKPWMIAAVLALAGLAGLGVVSWLASSVASAATSPPLTAGEATAAALPPTATPTHTPTPSPTPTPTPIPDAWLVQTENGSVYLLEEPGFVILTVIANGAEVTPLGETATAGGITFRKVRYRNVDGWLAADQIARLRPGFRLVGDEGLWLFNDPSNEALLGYVLPGTAFHVLDTQDGWSHIRLSNGEEGWAYLPKPR